MKACKACRATHARDAEEVHPAECECRCNIYHAPIKKESKP